MPLDMPEIRDIKRDHLENELRDFKNDWNDGGEMRLAEIFVSAFTPEEFTRIVERMFVIRQK